MAKNTKESFGQEIERRTQEARRDLKNKLNDPSFKLRDPAGLEAEFQQILEYMVRMAVLRSRPDVRTELESIASDLPKVAKRFEEIQKNNLLIEEDGRAFLSGLSDAIFAIRDCRRMIEFIAPPGKIGASDTPDCIHMIRAWSFFATRRFRHKRDRNLTDVYKKTSSILESVGEASGINKGLGWRSIKDSRSEFKNRIAHLVFRSRATLLNDMGPLWGPRDPESENQIQFGPICLSSQKTRVFLKLYMSVEGLTIADCERRGWITPYA